MQQASTGGDIPKPRQDSQAKPVMPPSSPVPTNTRTISNEQASSGPPPNHPSAVVASTSYSQSGGLNTLCDQEGDSGSLALAMAAGSIIGLTAAAAVRWLNGGDFYLFPPATAATTTSAACTRSFPAPPRNAGSSANPEGTPNPTTGSDVDANSLEILVSRMQSQVDQHEQLLAKFQSMTNGTPASPPNVSTATDHSMDLLLRHDESNTSTILREIRSLLTSLQVDRPDFSTRLQETLDKLDTTLIGMNGTAMPSIPSSRHRYNGTSLASALTQLVLDNPNVAKLQAAAQMLYLYVVNLSSHPKIPRYRKIFTSNETYQNHIAEIMGADSLLQAIGFVERATAWEWEPSDEEACLGCLRQAAAALSILKVHQPAQETPEALLQYVLAKVGLETAATPPRRMSRNSTEDGAFTTPVHHTDIVSPPATKKQLTPPLEVDFPDLTHPLAETAELSDSTGSPVVSFLHREEATSRTNNGPTTDAEAVCGDTVMWK